MIRHRQRGQIIPLAMFGVIVAIGAVALVVDAGVFLVTERQLQTAVDAAALEAAWYMPACDPGVLIGGSSGCQISRPILPPTIPASWGSCADPAQCAAFAVLQENMGFAGPLCGGTPQPPNTAVKAYGSSGLSEYAVSVTCTAPYWFANIFPDMPTMNVSAKAAATVGFPNTTNTDVTSTPNGHLMSRLVAYPTS
jgi:hypothetical protein